MKNIYWVLLLFPLIQAYATHAPMSEMVMFNRSNVVDSLKNQEKVSVTVFNPNPSLKNFKDGSQKTFLIDKYRIPNVYFSGLRSYKNNYSLSVSMGTSFGIDGTVNLFKNMYGTASISAMRSNTTIPAFINKDVNLISAIRNYHFSIQAPIVNKPNHGISIGYFFQRDAKMWKEKHYPCEMCFIGQTEYGIVSFLSHGFKSTMQLRSNYDSKYSFSCFTRIGKVIDQKKYYLTFGITLSPLIRYY